MPRARPFYGRARGNRLSYPIIFNYFLIIQQAKPGKKENIYILFLQVPKSNWVKHTFYSKLELKT